MFNLEYILEKWCVALHTKFLIRLKIKLFSASKTNINVLFPEQNRFLQVLEKKNSFLHGGWKWLISVQIYIFPCQKCPLRFWTIHLHVNGPFQSLTIGRKKISHDKHRLTVPRDIKHFSIFLRCMQKYLAFNSVCFRQFPGFLLASLASILVDEPDPHNMNAEPNEINAGPNEINAGPNEINCGSKWYECGYEWNECGSEWNKCGSELNKSGSEWNKLRVQMIWMRVRMKWMRIRIKWMRFRMKWRRIRLK